MNKCIFMRRGKVVEMARGARTFVATDEKERLLSKIEVAESGCWLWTDAPSKDGYGKFQASSGKTERAHRSSWRLHRGEIPSGLLCLHSCDNPPCVNPDHLFLGSQKDNILDMTQKGRRAKPGAVINEAIAAKIKGLLLTGMRPVEVASATGASKATVYSIKYGQAWKDVAPVFTE